MEILARNIMEYLIRHGLLSRREVVDGGVVVAAARNRNRNFLVKRKAGPSFFIKQALDTEPMAAQTVSREALFYQGVFADKRFECVSTLLPRLCHVDAEEKLLITELLEDTETISQCHSRLERYPVELGRKLGEKIASYHQIRFAVGQPQPDLFPKTVPWIFLLYEQSDLSSINRSPAAAALTSELLKNEKLGAFLAKIKSAWVPDTLCHIDMKWTNCLIGPLDASTAQKKLWIVDWELVDIGDPAWDVGSAMQSYISEWIALVSAHTDCSADERLSTSEQDMEKLKPALRALWEGYRDSVGFAPDAAQAFALKSVRMAAARLLITAYEACMHTDRVSEEVSTAVHLVQGILEDPSKAAVDLFGLGGIHG